ncbi:MAG TPA: uracil-DNA glycosylase [Candidatus Cloacimonadota bacterium]|nr:uracil-DNA glycosylase [Candidatus Cloacimonadota bacterium]HQB41416.1 uracil-DNA glycosylase [Candidatus Cloacimonadota bacterium]
MSLRSFKQYIELLQLSGLSYLVTDFNKINIKVEKNKAEIDDDNYELSDHIVCSPNTDIITDEKFDELGLYKLKDKIQDCQKCGLAKSRLKLVYGEGPQTAKIMIISEGPGAEENITGRPFVGEAGKLLTKMLAAINLQRSEVYIANIVKCRPPKNRTPQQNEIDACMPYLQQQIRVIQPQVILLLGKTAIISMLKNTRPIDTVRDAQPFIYQNIPVWVTYHPAALLRDNSLKRKAWADLQKFRDFLIEKRIKEAL